MTLAILCSGQGPQHPNMFALTGDAPEAANLFVHAAALLGGCDPRAIVRTDPKAAIRQDRTGQIHCTLQALAAALRDAWPDRQTIAGCSVGEVAAWSDAGLVDATTTLELVSRRAEAMDAASRPGDGLLFVRGLSRDAVEDLCKRHDAAVAIINPGDTYVLGGTGRRWTSLGRITDAAGRARDWAALSAEIGGARTGLKLPEQKLHNLSKVKTVKERRLLQQRAERDVDTWATSNKEFKLEN